MAVSAADIHAGLCTTGAPPIAITELTITEAQDALWYGSITCSDLVDAHLQRIAALDQKTGLNAVRAVNTNAREAAAAADVVLKSARLNGNRTALKPLFCVPILLKDNIDSTGMPTTGGSAYLAESFPAGNAHVTTKLENAGAIVLGKSNMGELAFFPSFCISSSGGTVRNPYHLGYTPAGSSGGSAAGVSAGFALAALGTDTGNSVRGPASHTALVGLRPSLGLIGRSGIIPLRLDRDTVGPLTRSVYDTALLLGALTGPDPGDNFTSILQSSVSVPDNYTQYLKSGGLAGARVASFDQIAGLAGTDPGILQLFSAALADMVSAGAVVLDNFRIENNSLGADWDAARDGEGPALGHWNVNGHWEDLWGCQSPVREGFNEFMDTTRRIEKRNLNGSTPSPEYMMAPANESTPTLESLFASRQWHPQAGTDIASAVHANYTSDDYPTQSMRGSGFICRCGPFWTDPCRSEFRKQFVASMDAVRADVVVYPTWGQRPLKVGDLGDGYYDGNNSPMIAPQVGAPAITVPMGYTEGGLPAGLQILARPFDEPVMLRVAYAFEQFTQHRRASPLFKECTGAVASDGKSNAQPAGSKAAG